MDGLLQAHVWRGLDELVTKFLSSHPLGALGLDSCTACYVPFSIYIMFYPSQLYVNTVFCQIYVYLMRNVCRSNLFWHLVTLHTIHRGLIKLNYSFKDETNDTSLLNLIYALIDKFGKFDKHRSFIQTSKSLKIRLNLPGGYFWLHASFQVV